MRRRDFMKIIGGAGAGWPFIARAQQLERMRRIGIFEASAEMDHAVQARWSAMREALAKLGWIDGRNARFDLRFSAEDPDRIRAHADELIRLAPDVIAVSSGAATRALVQRTRTIPIVFTNVGDPVAASILKNIARPEGNATGITSQYQSIAGKWLELLKEAAPSIARVALVFTPGLVATSYFAVIDETAKALSMRAIQTPYRHATELERAIDLFAAEPNGGLVMVPLPPSQDNRELINRLAVRHRLPTIYPQKIYGPAEGGMMSYGSDGVEVYRAVATYIDRILRGAKIDELPVQFPTKFELVINLKTAAAIGLTIPESLLFRADEVIR